MVRVRGSGQAQLKCPSPMWGVPPGGGRPFGTPPPGVSSPHGSGALELGLSRTLVTLALHRRQQQECRAGDSNPYQNSLDQSRFCVSSLHGGHANLLCIVPILSDVPKDNMLDTAWYIYGQDTMRIHRTSYRTIVHRTMYRTTYQRPCQVMYHVSPMGHGHAPGTGQEAHTHCRSTGVQCPSSLQGRLGLLQGRFWVHSRGGAQVSPRPPEP